MKIAAPIILGYIPAGLAFGVLAREGGLSVASTLVMSLLVLAGSAQFMMIAQLSAGVPIISVVATAAIVNLRYLLMSTAIASRLSRFPPLEKFLVGLQMTDEVFVINAGRLDALSASGDSEEIAERAGEPAFRAETHGVDTASHLTWTVSTMIGAAFGSILGDVQKYGIDFALTGVFIALLAPRLHDKKQLTVALCAGAASLALLALGAGQWNVILATVVAATLGMML